jgi:hypothetical protein
MPVPQKPARAPQDEINGTKKANDARNLRRLMQQKQIDKRNPASGIKKKRAKNKSVNSMSGLTFFTFSPADPTSASEQATFWWLPLEVL